MVKIFYQFLIISIGVLLVQEVYVLIICPLQDFFVIFLFVLSFMLQHYRTIDVSSKSLMFSCQKWNVLTLTPII